MLVSVFWKVERLKLISGSSILTVLVTFFFAGINFGCIDLESDVLLAFRYDLVNVFVNMQVVML